MINGVTIKICGVKLNPVQLAKNFCIDAECVAEHGSHYFEKDGRTRVCKKGWAEWRSITGAGDYECDFFIQDHSDENVIEVLRKISILNDDIEFIVNIGDIDPHDPFQETLISSGKISKVDTYYQEEDDELNCIENFVTLVVKTIR